MACWSEEEEVLRKLVNSFANNLRETGLNVKVDKTAILNVNRNEEEAIEMVVDGRRVQNVDQFQYLGNIFTRFEGCVRETEEE